MRILVIGSEGTIGTQLVKELKKDTSVQLMRCDRVRQKHEDYMMADISHYETLEPAFTEAPEVVFHLAGEVSRETSEHWPNIAVENNILGTLNVIRLCLKYGSKMIFAGTSEEYGSLFLSGGAVTEDMRPFGQQGIYGLTKWLAEEFIEYYYRRYGLKALVARIFMCYGPGEYPNPYRSAVARFIEWARHNEPIHVHRGGKRCWCYVDDIISGLISLSLYNKENYSIFNIGNEEVVDMEEVARQIIKLINSKSQISLEEAPSGVTLVKKANFKKAESLLGWKAKVRFSEGLKRTVEWHLKEIPL